MTSAAFPAFEYRGDTLHCEGVSLAALADAVGTPTYVYSRGAIEAAYKAYDAALAGVDHLICYSVKANSSVGILNVLARLGAAADIVSAGERARIALRVHPDVDAQTHPYISTGLTQNKFGIAAAAARDAFRRAAELPNLDVRGIDCHIGSQLTKTSPFADAIARLCELILSLAGEGIQITDLDIGGGLGIDYGKDGDTPPPSHGEYGSAVKQAMAVLGDHPVRLLVEPGRSIVGPAGVLLGRVLYNKDNEVKHFTIVDAAMNDLIRPSFYGSHHPMRPVTRSEAAPRKTDVVGPICETGDFLARDRALPPMARGELLAIGAAGADGVPLSSHYTTRPRSAEVLVQGERWTVIRERETLEHLVRGERIAE